MAGAAAAGPGCEPDEPPTFSLKELPLSIARPLAATLCRPRT